MPYSTAYALPSASQKHAFQGGWFGLSRLPQAPVDTGQLLRAGSFGWPSNDPYLAAPVKDQTQEA